MTRLWVGVLALASWGCTEPPPLPDNGDCSGAIPGSGDGSRRTVTFPARDFVCAEDDLPPCALTVPLRTDTERTVTVTDELGGVTVSYLLDSLSLSQHYVYGSPGAAGVGFDLDGLDTGQGSDALEATCEQVSFDFPSEYEPGVQGVDNVFADMVPLAENLFPAEDCPGMAIDGCIDALLKRDVHEGRLLLLLELTGVNSTEHDPEVAASLYYVRMLGGGAPALEGSRVASGLTFETVRMLAGPTDADIFHHRLRARWEALELPRDRFGYPSRLSDVELRGSVCAAGFHGAHLGGVARVVDLQEQVDLRASSDFASGARDIIQSWADVWPGPDPEVCTGVSVAYAVEGVPASRAP